MSIVIRALCVFMCVAAFNSLKAYEQVEGTTVHEGFLTPAFPNIALQAVEQAPPPPVIERTPQQPDSSSLWIPGYWEWDDDRNDYVWVSGVWRKPPPGRTWIPGFWQQVDAGWIRVHGFWSQVPQEEIHYVTLIPPDPIDEQPGDPPSDDVFWAPGYWDYDDEAATYFWIKGSWNTFDPNWIYVPSYYVWRPEGYVLVVAYWDLPIEERGAAYPIIFFPQDERVDVTYTPTVVVEPIVIVQRLLVCYPDYSYFYCHHYHYNPHFWDLYPDVPPWWGWGGNWWSFTWHDNWGLWWWYCHPGYPQPQWLSASYAQKMAPPSQKLLLNVNRFKGPDIVTPNGVVTPNRLLRALDKADVKTGKKFIPVLPANRQQLDKVKIAAEPQKDIRTVIRPSGQTLPLDKRTKVRERIAKPNIQISQTNQKLLDSKVNRRYTQPLKVPEKPSWTAVDKIKLPPSQQHKIQIPRTTPQQPPVNVQEQLKQQQDLNQRPQQNRPINVPPPILKDGPKKQPLPQQLQESKRLNQQLQQQQIQQPQQKNTPWRQQQFQQQQQWQQQPLQQQQRQQQIQPQQKFQQPLQPPSRQSWQNQPTQLQQQNTQFQQQQLQRQQQQLQRPPQQQLQPVQQQQIQQQQQLLQQQQQQQSQQQQIQQNLRMNPPNQNQGPKQNIQNRWSQFRDNNND